MRSFFDRAHRVGQYRPRGITLISAGKRDPERHLDAGVVSLPAWRPDPRDIGAGQPGDAAVSVYGAWPASRDAGAAAYSTRAMIGVPSSTVRPTVHSRSCDLRTASGSIARAASP